MNMGLEGKVVIVTGAVSGIGAAIARLLAEEGVGGLVMVDRDGEGARRLAAALSVEAAVVQADLAYITATEVIAAGARAHFGRIDGLVNAAGLTTRGSFVTGTPAVWDQLCAVNARAAFFLMQSVIADMQGRGRRARSSTSCR